MTRSLDHVYWARVLEDASDPETPVVVRYTYQRKTLESLGCIRRADFAAGPHVESDGLVQTLCPWECLRSIETPEGVDLEEVAERLAAERGGRS